MGNRGKPPVRAGADDPDAYLAACHASLPRRASCSTILMLSYLKRGQETAMHQTEFETELGKQGYGEVINRRMEANSLNPEHAHDFDARLLVLEGAMTIISEGQERMYRAGDTFSMPAGCRHAEQCGPEGVSLPSREAVPDKPLIASLFQTRDLCLSLDHADSDFQD